jgi:hypothetical protein
VYLYQAEFFKEVRIDLYCKIPIKVRQYVNIILSHGTDSAFTLATLNPQPSSEESTRIDTLKDQWLLCAPPVVVH